MTKTLKVFTGCLGSIVIVCGLGGWAAWRYSDFGRASAELDQAVVDAKAAGLPWLAADLSQAPPVKEAENAAALTRQVLALMHGDSATKKALSAFGLAQSAGDVEATDTALKSLGSWIALARTVGDRPQCDFRCDWDQGAWLLLPEFAAEKQMAKVLAACAEREARVGDWTRSLEDLRRIVQIGRHARSDPCLIGMLVGIVCDAVAMRCAEQIAEAAHDNGPMLGSLRKTLAEMGPEPDFHYALKGEVYMGISTIRNLQSLSDVRRLAAPLSSDGPSDFPPPPKKFVRSGLPHTLFGRIFLCRHLQMWIRVDRELKDVRDPIRIGAILDHDGEVEQRASWSHYLNTILLPVFSQAGVSVVKMTATRSTVRGLAAVLEYRARHGRYPKSLAEAGFSEIDPFSGKPMLYRVEGNGCKVYSVGPDKEDNRGVRESERPDNWSSAKPWHWDIVASYPAYRKAAVPRRAPPRP